LIPTQKWVSANASPWDFVSRLPGLPDLVLISSPLKRLGFAFFRLLKPSAVIGFAHVDLFQPESIQAWQSFESSALSERGFSDAESDELPRNMSDQ
jgi:hypothetical protein